MVTHELLEWRLFERIVFRICSRGVMGCKILTLLLVHSSCASSDFMLRDLLNFILTKIDVIQRRIVPARDILRAL